MPGRSFTASLPACKLDGYPVAKFAYRNRGSQLREMGRVKVHGVKDRFAEGLEEIGGFQRFESQA
jgi:hypothetical protein